MVIYGVAILAFCFLLGKLIGESLGKVLHVDANMGGVGFAMLLLIICNQWMHKRKLFSSEMDSGVMFWNKMYIPVIVAMSASQDVAVAISGGFVALFAGVLSVAICFSLIPVFSRFSYRN